MYVARHAAAAYETDLWTDDGGSLTVAGRAQAMALGHDLETEGIVHVWTSPLSRSVQTAELAAATLVTGVTVREGLREFSVGAFAGDPLDPDPLVATYLRWLHGDLDARVEGGESGAEVAQRFGAVLDEAVEQHTGETVLVFSHGGVMGVGLPALVGNLAQDMAEQHPLPSCGLVELAADDQQWRAVRWLDEELPAT